MLDILLATQNYHLLSSYIKKKHFKKFTLIEMVDYFS